ncbi:fluoride efflux transporter CrcB [Phorcysia thermohydrogeniphila]|uniref:Fluoride-specific ion channel FluC n=1 Tax=Phorcysia thermohydrogeniphila TaxID=936138 RepID=A0A4R1GDI7_9BACT|nr:fluoride efflux transporter CrcB [Phorcysia thermohydrogeniphila]TCK04655.1 CrcB protein [Phorcysia thermohydrogeniphila]
MTLLFIGLGGFFGAISRFLISGFVQKLLGTTFPFGTLSVNVIGSFLIGFLVMLFENMLSPEWKAFFITGFLGALTTFSTFSLETVVLLQEGLYERALLNVALNVLTCLIATVCGMALFKAIFKV